ncbi:MAG TPA: hypothetical protein VGH76_07635, partial [Actinomycetospora sp.]|uniref:hypothetical protein n=1 Tax=Actinomycetospora sp. TaxID=1872135 RepID=UPI002F40D76D
MPKRRVPVRALREIADAVSAERSTSFATVEVGRAALVAALRDKLHASPELAAALARVQADNPMSSAVGIGPGASVVHNAGPVFRAAYLIRAAQRTQAADDPSAQATAERRYLRQHQTAQAAREIGAMRLDAARAAYGRTLGWYARDDDRVTPECAAASGKNFDPTHPPAIGLPGLGPHVGCRCVAGPPHAGAAFLSGGVPEVAPLPGTTVREPAHLPGDAAIAASVSSGRAVDLAASSKKPKPGPGGTEVQGDGLTYDPATRSFHPTTSAEGDFNSKHPRVAKGKAGGGKFTNKSGGGSGSGSSKGSGSKGSGSGSKGSGSKGSSGGSSGSSSGGSSGSSSAAQTAASKRLIAATAAAAKAKTAADKKAAAAEVAAAKAALVAAKAKAAADAKAHPPAPSKTVGMAVDSMEKASTPSPIGAPGGPGLWRHKGKQLPPYIQHIAKALIRGGMAESHAIASAVNTVKRWAVGGGQVHPDTQAAAGKALAEWEADKAESHAHSNGQAGIELADGPHRYRRKKGGTRVPVDLAVQVGSVPVRASGDGPRVTGSATGRAAFLVALGKRKKKRRRRPVSLSFWNEAKHPRAPKGTHLGGEWWKAGSLGSSKKKTHDDLRGLLTGRD